MDKPYVSFVVVGRNDNYGHKFLERFQRFLDNLIYLCEKYKLPSELIIVEWNPPEENKKLYGDLKIKEERSFVEVRFVEVPKKIHNSFENSDKFPLFEYIGKNAGIRRAKGDFVLVTNPDIIFGEEVIKEIAMKKLDRSTLYRTNRYDIQIDIPSNMGVKDVESFCEKNWNFCWSVNWGFYYRGFEFFKSLRKFLIRAVAKLIPRFSYLKYHGGAPGDFMLISKKGWEDFCGFPEIKRHFGMDSYGCVIAVANNNKFVSMKGPTYHQFHERDTASRPILDRERYGHEIKKMLSEHKPIKYNTSDWGLNEYKLEEKSF